MPDYSEAIKFRAYVEEFFILSYAEFFSTDFNEISLVDLVKFDDVKIRLKSAEDKLKNSDYNGAIAEVAIAKSIIFSKVSRYFPKVDSSLSKADQMFRKIPGISEMKVFAYIYQYLAQTRESNIVAMLGIPLHDYVFINRYFPSVTKTLTGKWYLQVHANEEPNEKIIVKAIQMLVNTSIRAQDIIGKA